MSQLPVSALLPTRDRFTTLTKMFNSLAQQSVQPQEIIIVDASEDDLTQQLCQSGIPGLDSQLIYQPAQIPGAASQRNQAIASATQPYIWLIEDDITFEPDCLARLWQALQSDRQLGGVNAMITNQKYLPPGKFSRYLYWFLHGKREASYAGKCLGGAVNLLPEDCPDLPPVVPVEWLNSGCTLYRREALPSPLFPTIFTGYSLLEDLTLSLTVGKQWQLANARTARIFHDSQPAAYKSNLGNLAKMDLVNRHYVMTQVLEQRSWQDYLKLGVFQIFNLAGYVASSRNWLGIRQMLGGQIKAIAEITKHQAVN